MRTCMCTHECDYTHSRVQKQPAAGLSDSAQLVLSDSDSIPLQQDQRAPPSVTSVCGAPLDLKE